MLNDGDGTWNDLADYEGRLGLVEKSSAAPAVTGIFDFTFTYGNGDFYTGQVYAPVDYGYYLGATVEQTDKRQPGLDEDHRRQLYHRRQPGRPGFL